MVEELRVMFLKELLGDNKELKEKFISNFEADITAFIDSIVELYQSWKRYDSTVGSDRRRAFVAAFLFNAISSLIVSMKMLIAGYTVPSGNLVRQTIESMCSAILCSSDKIQFYQKVEQNRFSSGNSVSLVLRHAKMLRIDKSAMNSLKNLYEFYHKLSHSSSLTLAFNISIGNLGQTYIGPSFDEEKLFAYGKETANRVNLSRNITNVVEDLLLSRFAGS